MTLATHDELLGCCEWAFPNSFDRTRDGFVDWDGLEDPQVFTDREWEWRGIPIPIVDVLAKEADWRSSLATSTQRNIDESILIDSVSNTAFLLIKLIDLLRTNGGVSQSDIDTLDTKTKQTYIDMKDAISRLRP